jgi:hypothetical protein
MKKITSFLICILFASQVFTQQLNLVDEISGRYGNINDVGVNQFGQRYYLIDRASDSIVVNGNISYLPERDSTIGSPYRFGRSYLLGVTNGSHFIHEPGGSGLALNDSSVSYFTAILDTLTTIYLQDTFIYIDTLFLPDTFYVSLANGNGGRNLISLEYEFNGNMLSSKHWPSTFNCSMGVNQFDPPFFCGEYGGNEGGLLLDGHFLDIGSGNGNAFVGAMDADYGVKWLQSVSGEDYQSGSMFSINNEKHLLLTGFSASSYLYFCGDSLENQAFFDWGTDFLWFVQFDTLGNCVNKKTVDYYYGSIVPTSITSLSDGSYIVSGDYFAPYIGFDSTYLYSPVFDNEIDNIGFLVKLDDNLNAQAVFQLEGSQGNKSIHSMIVDSLDNIWICGYANVDTLIIGDEILINTAGNSSLGFIAQLNSDFSVVSSTKLEGAGRKLVYGSDGNVYLLVAYDTSLLQKLFRVDHSTSHVQNNFRDKNELEVIIFPNPLGNNKKLHYKLLNETRSRITQIEVYDLFGRNVISKSISEQQGELIINNTSSILFVVFRINDSFKIIKKIIVN